MGMGTLTALKHWLIVHIVTSDQAYAEYYHRQEPAPESPMAVGENREHTASPAWADDAYGGN